MGCTESTVAQNSKITPKQELRYTKDQYLDLLMSYISKQQCLHQLIDKNIIVELSKDIKGNYLTQQNKESLIKILQDFIQVNLSVADPNFANNTKYKNLDNFGEQLGKQLMKMETEFKTKNYQIKQSLQYFDFFKKLKFTIEPNEQSQNVMKQVGYLCNREMLSIFYISSYLMLCCERLEIKQKKIQKVVQILKEKATYHKDRLAVKGQKEAQNVYLKNQADETIQSAKIKSIPQKPYEKVNFILIQNQKQNQLDGKIMQMVQIGRQIHPIFKQIVYSACVENNGFGFKSNLKLNSKNQISALRRVKEKLFKQKIKQNIQNLKEEKKTQFSNCKRIQQWIKLQQEIIKQGLSSIYEGINKVQFNISDLVRGKCLFNKVSQINKAAQCIMEKVSQQFKKGKNIQIVQIDNRLQKLTKDLVLKIRIENLVCQFQLSLFFMQSTNAIHHKMYELVRSQPISCLYLLNQWNQKARKAYFSTIINVIEYENSQKQQNMKNKLQQMKDFLSLVDNMRKKSKLQKQEIDKFKMKIHKNYKNILSIKNQGQTKQKEIKRLINTGMFYNEQKKYELSLNNLRNGLNLIQKNNKQMKDQYKENQLIIILKKMGVIYDDKGQYKKALQHYNRCLEIQQRIKGKGCIDTASTLNNIGTVYKNMGNYKQAIQHYKKCLEIEQRINGKGSIDTASTLNNIGLVQKNMGNYKQAIQHYNKCLEIQQRIKGKGCIDTASTLNNIGVVYKNMGNYKQAIQYYNRCLEIQQRIKGKGSIDTTSILNNIGSVYESMGNYKQAIQHHNRCLEIKQRIKGKGCIDTALTLNNIGSVYKNMGNYKQAIQHYNRCLEIKQRIKGRGSIDTASTLNNIGSVYKNIGNYKQALQHYSRCLEIQQRIKGKGSIDTASTLNNIGSVYDSMGNYKQALQHYNRCLEIQQRIKGKGCIDTASTLNNIGSVYDSMGNYKQALQHYNRCLEIQQRIKGKGCIDTASTLNNIGLVQKNMGNYKQAIQHYNRCLEIQQRIKGKGCIDTASTLNNIGSVYDSMGNYKQAIQHYKRCLKIQQRIKGKGSIDTASTLNNIGSVYDSMGNYKQALQHYNRCLEIQQRIKGKGSIDTALTLNNIGTVQKNMGNYKQALQHYNQCLEIEQRIKGKGSIDTASTLNNIGDTQFKMLNYQTSLQYFQLSLTIYQKILGIASKQFKYVQGKITLCSSKIKS